MATNQNSTGLSVEEKSKATKLSRPQQGLLDVLKSGPRLYSWQNKNVLRTARSLANRGMVSVTSAGDTYNFKVTRTAPVSHDESDTDMKRREGEWEDNGCRPLTGYEPIEDDWSVRS